MQGQVHIGEAIGELDPIRPFACRRWVALSLNAEDISHSRNHRHRLVACESVRIARCRDQSIMVSRLPSLNVFVLDMVGVGIALPTDGDAFGGIGIYLDIGGDGTTSGKRNHIAPIAVSQIVICRATIH